MEGIDERDGRRLQPAPRVLFAESMESFAFPLCPGPASVTMPAGSSGMNRCKFLMEKNDMEFKTVTSLICILVLLWCTPGCSRTNDPLAAARSGLLDITASPYSADPGGKTDCTAVLQKALNDAEENGMAVYLPVGRYLVSDTLQAKQNINTPMLRGATRDGRATIVLADNAPGFGDVKKPKAVIDFMRVRDGRRRNPNVNFNQTIVSVDLELGRDNPGAIGLDHQGAQGCVTEDVHIDATGGFAGFRGMNGSGGGASHISVRGGLYGLYIAGLGKDHRSGSQPAPVISVLKLTGQTRCSIHADGLGPLTLVAAEIDGPGIEVVSHGHAWDGALNMVDSIVHKRGDGPAIGSNRPVYLSNVYFKNAPVLVKINEVPALQGTDQGWMHVEEYAAGPSAKYPVWINGVKQAEPVSRVRKGRPPAPDLFAVHQWHNALPDWNDPLVANVKEPPYSAAGDGKTDDTAAIQEALNKCRDVFLPKGDYRISKPLLLGTDSRLFGLGICSRIEPDPAAPAFADPAAPRPMLVAPNDAGASCVAAFFQLRAWIPGSYAIHWQAGRHSMVRNVLAMPFPWMKGGLPAMHPLVLIDGHGGGRWYNALMHHKFPQANSHRHVLVRGTREPLAFYMLNPEHSSAGHMIEFDDVRNLNVYSTKSETLGAKGPKAMTPFLIQNSSHFRILGHGGNACPEPGHPLFRIRNCSDFALSNFGHMAILGEVTDPSKWFMVEEIQCDGSIVRTPGTECFPLYSRD
jgi:hypothetical protein